MLDGPPGVDPVLGVAVRATHGAVPVGSLPSTVPSAVGETVTPAVGAAWSDGAPAEPVRTSADRAGEGDGAPDATSAGVTTGGSPTLDVPGTLDRDWSSPPEPPVVRPGPP